MCMEAKAKPESKNPACSLHLLNMGMTASSVNTPQKMGENIWQTVGWGRAPRQPRAMFSSSSEEHRASALCIFHNFQR
jgi:hypothetical protein